MRKSNFELLRIVSIFLIVLSHFCVHTPWPDSMPQANYLFTRMFSLGEVGVACFVFTTGFFSYKKALNTTSLFKVILQVSFYSLCSFFISNTLSFSQDSNRFSFTPILSGTYWFATAYVGMLLFQPYINFLIASLSRRQHKALLLFSLVIFGVPQIVSSSNFIYSNVLYFIFLYLCGAYWSIYGNPLRQLRLSAHLTLTIGGLALLLGAIGLASLHPLDIAFFHMNRSYLISLQSVPLIVVSSVLFLFFERLNLGSNKVINGISKHVFGVYLLSDNPLIRYPLWTFILTTLDCNSSIAIFAINALLSSLCVVATSLIIDAFRYYLLEIPLFRLFSKPLLRINSLVKDMYSDHQKIQA